MVVLVLLVDYIDWLRLWNWFFDVIDWVWVYVVVPLKKKFYFYLNNEGVGVVGWLCWFVDVFKLVEVVEINFLMLFVDCESILLLRVVDAN